MAEHRRCPAVVCSDRDTEKFLSPETFSALNSAQETRCFLFSALVSWCHIVII